MYKKKNKRKSEKMAYAHLSVSVFCLFRTAWILNHVNVQRNISKIKQITLDNIGWCDVRHLVSHASAF
jgi:hypothetical protein